MTDITTHNIRGATSCLTSSPSPLLVTCYVSTYIRPLLLIRYSDVTLFKAYWLLDTIYRQAIYNKEDKSSENGEFVPLSLKILQKVIGTRFTGPIIGGLLELGAIERDPAYCPKIKCMGYRLTENAKRDITPITFDYPSLAAKIAAKRNSDRSAYQYLAKVFDSVGFDAKVMTIVDQLPVGGPHRLLYDDVAEKRYYLKCHKKTGRLFHPVCNLPSNTFKLRSFVTIGGEPTVEVDVACAQPSLLIGFYPTESQERLRFIEAIQNDRIYTFASDHLGIPRAKAKIEFLRQILYGPIQAYYPLFAPFCDWFPELGRIVTELRFKLGKSKFACEMQRREANIVIRKVLPDCIKEGLAVLPIHDALLCKRSEALSARAIMLRHWTDALGFEPFVRCKPELHSCQQLQLPELIYG